MKQSRQENIIYLAVWSLLFAAPLLSMYVRSVGDAGFMFSWHDAFVVWRHFALYLILFLVHNFLLAPLLVYQHRRTAYIAVVLSLLVAFTLYQCNTRPDRGGHKPDCERVERDRPQLDNPPPPPPIVGEHDIMAIVILILIFGANLGIKGYFRTRDDQKRLAELEKENLEQQLEYLRYQINPHFFMNTLNNIHALVDIDPEQAKDTILELSKMMRFVLYEGNRQSVPLSRELDFIQHYVSLMQLRYTEKVRITLTIPSQVPDRHVPPLILITFIENAFKHGISYQSTSFIEIVVVAKDGHLRFVCRNSKTENPNQEKGGVGLANVRKRLDLLYSHRYTLNIQDSPKEYLVELTLPLL